MHTQQKLENTCKNTNPNADNLKDKAKDHIKIINNGTSFNNTLTLNSNNKIKGSHISHNIHKNTQ